MNIKRQTILIALLLFVAFICGAQAKNNEVAFWQNVEDGNFQSAIDSVRSSLPDPAFSRIDCSAGLFLRAVVDEVSRGHVVDLCLERWEFVRRKIAHADPYLFKHRTRLAYLPKALGFIDHR